MKQYCFLFIFVILFFHTGCTGKKSTAKHSTETDIQTVPETKQSIETDTQVFSDNNAEEELDLLYIGGKQYRGSWDEEKVYLRVDPEDPDRRNSLENIELFRNLKELTIKGKNLDKVDFSPISLLTKLEKLEIEGNITRMPDMTNLKQLRKVEIGWAALESLEGINGINLEEISIQSHGSNSDTMLKVSDMKNLNKLKEFDFMFGKIDLEGIDRFNSLEFIQLYYSEPYNINNINGLKNLKTLIINLISENPSIEFIRNMPNLSYVAFFGNNHLYIGLDFEEYNPSQVLDVAPLATLKKLQSIKCNNLIIKNISALDVLDLNRYIDLYGSKLYDKKEKSKHTLQFERGDR